MIPFFNEHGYLPPGIHAATMDTIVQRFGTGSETREAQGQSLQWLLPLCRPAGISRWLINGSFVTDVVEPNDVDCVLLQGPSFRASSRAARSLRRGMPFLELKIVRQKQFDFLVNIMFASDRAMVPKGIVEVIL